MKPANKKGGRPARTATYTPALGPTRLPKEFIIETSAGVDELLSHAEVANIVRDARAYLHQDNGTVSTRVKGREIVITAKRNGWNAVYLHSEGSRIPERRWATESRSTRTRKRLR